MSWVIRLYVVLLGVCFLGAGAVALTGVTWSWTGMLLVLPVALLLVWLGGHALVAGIVSCVNRDEPPADPGEPDA